MYPLGLCATLLGLPSFTIPDNVFQDLDAGDVLTYSATLGDGNALPNWLSFAPNTRTLSGTPSKEDVGNLSLKITVTDNANEAISNTFSLEIQNLRQNLTGNSGNNFLRGLVGDDTIDGGAGNDVIRGGAGADVLNGGEGLDILNYRYSSVGVAVNLTTGLAEGGDAEGNTFVNFERLYGSSFGDSLVGDDSNNLLLGLLGNDTISGGAGNDNIQGREGKDILTGDSGKDTFYLNQLNHSLFGNFDLIPDLSIGEDILNAPVAISAANISDYGTLSDFTEAGY